MKTFTTRWVSPILTIAFPRVALASAITRVTPLSIMAAVALATIGRPSERIDIIGSDDWPGEGTEQFSDDNDEERFFQDGLNTGARIQGE